MRTVRYMGWYFNSSRGAWDSPCLSTQQNFPSRLRSYEQLQVEFPLNINTTDLWIRNQKWKEIR